MRRESTDAERKFWYAVRDRRLGGHKFKRQVLIGNFVADFVCAERGLVVELDGGQHATQEGYDKSRDAFLAAKGFRVVRIWNDEFLKSKDGVLDMLLSLLDGSPSPASGLPSATAPATLAHPAKDELQGVTSCYLPLLFSQIVVLPSGAG